MKVFLCVPTALKKHAVGQFKKWRERGYMLALLTDSKSADFDAAMPYCELHVRAAEYPGVWKSWNLLAKAAVMVGADVCVLAGDDMDPDPKFTAEEIGAQYLERFPSGLGVMQPTGDRQGEMIGGKVNSERICGSPWVGRGWVTRAYRGEGPVDARFGAFFSDELLKEHAEKLGLLWQRSDLSQKHLHWSWSWLPKQEYHERNDREHWAKDKALYERVKGEPCSLLS